MSESLKKKILALLAKSEGTSNEHEALAFAEKAHQLMKEHRLSLGDLYMSKDPLGDFVINLPHLSDATLAVLVAAANYFGASVSSESAMGQEPIFKIIGRESARTVTALMVPFWWEQCAKRAEEMNKKKGRRGGSFYLQIFGYDMRAIIEETGHGGDTTEQMMMAFSKHLILTAMRNDTLDRQAIDEAIKFSDVKVNKTMEVGDYYIPPDVAYEAEQIPLSMQLGGSETPSSLPENHTPLPKK